MVSKTTKNKLFWLIIVGYFILTFNPYTGFYRISESKRKKTKFNNLLDTVKERATIQGKPNA